MRDGTARLSMVVTSADKALIGRVAAAHDRNMTQMVLRLVRQEALRLGMRIPEPERQPLLYELPAP